MSLTADHRRESVEPSVHASAVVDSAVSVASGVTIGPYALVQGEVQLGQWCRVAGHAVIHGPADVGNGCRFYPYSILGTDPQDQKFDGERTLVRVGEGCTLREFVTVNRGTGMGGGQTVIGSGSYLMAHTHVAHDCILGSHVVVANATTLAGHVVVGNHAVFGGHAAVGQYVRIGEGAFVAAGAMLERDLPPFAIAAGDRAKLRGVNLVGMRRMGLADPVRSAVSGAYGLLMRRDRKFRESLLEIETRWGDVPEVAAILAFIDSSQLGVIAPRG